MSAGFQAKISLLSRRKLVSASSYFAERLALMVAVLEASPVPRSSSNLLVCSASPSSYCSILGDVQIKSAGSTASDP